MSRRLIILIAVTMILNAMVCRQVHNILRKYFLVCYKIVRISVAYLKARRGFHSNQPCYKYYVPMAPLVIVINQISFSYKEIKKRGCLKSHLTAKCAKFLAKATKSKVLVYYSLRSLRKVSAASAVKIFRLLRQPPSFSEIRSKFRTR